VDIHELVIEVKLVKRRFTPCEEKHGVPTARFSAALISSS
jgi:hypothetical protein